MFWQHVMDDFKRSVRDKMRMTNRDAAGDWEAVDGKSHKCPAKSTTFINCGDVLL
jgi:hypothetical protein